MMIRYLTAAMLLMASPAMAQTQDDIEQANVFLQAGFAQKYCGIPVPDLVIGMMYDFTIRTGYDQNEFLSALKRQLEILGHGVEPQEIILRCGITLNSYRKWGLQR